MTKTLGIFGFPVSHSLSPLMHNTAIDHHKLDMRYLPFEVTPYKLHAAIAGIRALGIHGINLTIPHKESVIPLLDVIDPEAERVGAVNTICNKNGILTGYNTDGRGFVESLKKDADFSPAGKNIVIVGAGGAAKGIASALLDAGIASLTLANRTLSRCQELKALLLQNNVNIAINTISPTDISFDLMETTHALINTTSIGLKGENTPIFNYNFITGKHLICDIVYGIEKTFLIKEAELRGAKAIDGFGMLIYQGALAFKIWTDHEMPVNLVKSALSKKL